jgi:hypothetical protein
LISNEFQPYSEFLGTDPQTLKSVAVHNRGKWKVSRICRSYKILILILLGTLPLLNPLVRGDGVGYYAYVRSFLIEHDLNFEYDWLHANPSFRMNRVDELGNLTPQNFTVTHHLDNHFTVGPAILWAPFLAVVHGVILGLNSLGGQFQADGYSRPYLLTMALATALYGFAGICFAFALARRYVEEKWALTATIAIWFGSSLPVYMYLNPSWSHAHSAFAAGLFLWYWNRTSQLRSLAQWAVLGAISGIMVDIYYPNFILIIVIGIEALTAYAQLLLERTKRAQAIHLLLRHLLYMSLMAIVISPTFVTRQIIYGGAFHTGYTERWFWTNPKLSSVLFSSNHGLFSWTPLLVPAVFGLLLIWKQNRTVAISFVTVFLAYLYLIASYENWHGISSFGNRFFISLTPLFVLGLAMTLSYLSKFFTSGRRALLAELAVVSLFILWNVGLIFQWGAHLIPVRGPVSWKTVSYNQFVVVPAQIARFGERYLFRRRELMEQIEKQDVEKLKQESGE